MSKIVTFFNDFQTLHARIVMFSLESLCQVSLKIRLLKIFDAISFYVTSKKLSKIRPAAAQCSCNLQKHSTILRDFMHTKNPAKKLPMWSHFFSKLLRVPLTFVSSVVYWTSEVYPQFCYLKNLRLLCTFFKVYK